MYFEHLSFPKTGADIKAKAKELVDRLQAKINERKRVVAENAKQLGIASVEDALTRAEEIGLELSDENQVVHSKMLANRSKAKAEAAEIRDLKMIARNLPDDKVYDLSFQELEYFGF